MASCHLNPSPEPEPVEEALPVDTLTAIEHIEDRGVLIALTCHPDLNYHLHEGRPAGFQFELLDDFSEFLGADLELHVGNHHPVDLYAGEVDTTAIDTAFHYVFLELPVVTEHPFAWMIPHHGNDSSLLSAIDLWLQDYQGSSMRRTCYRYFDGEGKERQAMAESHISEFDSLIRIEANLIGWDWRMLASIIYQESRFKTDLVNEKGAFGLMQLMPVTMSRYGIDHESSVSEQLEAAGQLLMHFNSELPQSISDSLVRGDFILASYNAGMGHILEARLRAERHGKDPNLWIDNVELFVPKQTYLFVRDIKKRYSHYKALIE